MKVIIELTLFLHLVTKKEALSFVSLYISLGMASDSEKKH